MLWLYIECISSHQEHFQSIVLLQSDLPIFRTFYSLLFTVFFSFYLIVEFLVVNMFQLVWYSGFLRDQVAKRKCCYFLFSNRKKKNVSTNPYKFVFISIFHHLLRNLFRFYLNTLEFFGYLDKTRFG